MADTQGETKASSFSNVKSMTFAGVCGKTQKKEFLPKTRGEVFVENDGVSKLEKHSKETGTSEDSGPKQEEKGPTDACFPQKEA